MRTASSSKTYEVVVGVDFADQAANAIFESVQLARLVPQIRVQYVHVVDAESEVFDANVLEALNERLPKLLIRLERYVRDALFAFGGNEAWGCRVAFHVRLGSPSVALLQIAAETRADLIIVGAAQMRGLRRFYHRSTPERLLRAAQTPVIVAHHKRFRDPEEIGSQEPTATMDGLTTHGYVDFGEPRRDSHLFGSF